MLYSCDSNLILFRCKIILQRETSDVWRKVAKVKIEQYLKSNILAIFDQIIW